MAATGIRNHYFLEKTKLSLVHLFGGRRYLRPWIVVSSRNWVRKGTWDRNYGILGNFALQQKHCLTFSSELVSDLTASPAPMMDMAVIEN